MRSRTIPTVPHLLAVALCGALLVMSRPGGAADQGTAAKTSEPATETATFAGGCFWCMQPPFDAIDGVLSTTVGYTGGTAVDPTYEQVSAGGTGHAESIEVVFDPKRVTYAQLLNVFWRNVDPTNPNGQFCDVGNQYRSEIFFRSEAQKQTAERSKALLEASGKLGAPIATQIVAATKFYPAEDYHQDYYKKNPIRYKWYRYRCGRDERLEELWGEN